MAAPSATAATRLVSGARGLFTRSAPVDALTKARGFERLKQIWTGSRSKALKAKTRDQSALAYQEAATRHGIPPKSVRSHHLTSPRGQAFRALGSESAREAGLVGKVQAVKNIGAVAAPTAAGVGAGYHLKTRDPHE